MEQTQIAALVQKARAGDEEAMTQLLAKAQSSVIFQCRKIMQHPQDAEDMAQEVVLTIFQNLDKLQDPEEFLPWANRIAAYMCLNQKQRHPKDLQFLEDENGHSFLNDVQDEDRQHIPDAALDNEETKRLVTDLVDALPEAQRTAIYLYYYSEMSIREIAALTKVSENTVKSRLNYGRKALKEGFLGYEKEGIKLYSLSPLPFLLFLLRGAAESQADPVAAEAVAKAVLAGSAATAGTAGASGAAAGTAAAAETTAASAAATTATGTAAGTAAAGTAGGILGAVSVKVAAAVLAGVVAVGGVVAGVTIHNAGERPQADSRWTDPVPIAACTVEEQGGTYFPVFEEISEGYQLINQEIEHLAHSPASQPEIPLDDITVQVFRNSLPFSEEYQLIYQDGFFVSVYLRRCSSCYVPGQRGFTFDARTGELLTLADLTGGTEAEIASMLQEAVSSSSYASYLTGDNAPSANPEDWDYVIRDGEVCYLWLVEPGLSAVIPLPVDLPDSGMTPVTQSEALDTPAYTYRFCSGDSGVENLELYYMLPLFDSLEPGYQVINDYLLEWGENFLANEMDTLYRTYTPEDLATAGTPEYPAYVMRLATITEQDSRYLCLNLAQPQEFYSTPHSSWEHPTFDVTTGQEVSLREMVDLTDEEITDIALDWIANSEYADVLEREPFQYQNNFIYQDGQVCYVWTIHFMFRDGYDIPIPLTEPNS